MANEISTTRSVSQLNLIRDRGQISKEMQHLVRYYNEGSVSKELLFGNTKYGQRKMRRQFKIYNDKNIDKTVGSLTVIDIHKDLTTVKLSFVQDS